MKLGVSTSFSHSSPEEWAAKHVALGCEAVVFPVDYLAGEQVIDSYMNAAKAAGLRIAEVGVWRNVIAANPTERAQAVAYAIGQLRMADHIGAACCVNIAGAAGGNRWDGFCRENFSKEAWAATVAAVRQIVDTVNPVHTKYSLEPMPWMIPSGPEEYLQLLHHIERDNVGVHMDMVNMINCPKRYFFQEEFMEQCFDLLKGRILGCHLKDIHLRQEYTFQLAECACGDGELNLQLYTSLATKENADMPMIIEHLSTDEAYEQSIRYVQRNLTL